jgi:hypothetical protein
MLAGVVRGVAQHGARYGLSTPRRDLLALTLATLIRSLREDWEGTLGATLRAPQTGRPSQPHGGDGGTPDLSPPAARLTG